MAAALANSRSTIPIFLDAINPEQRHKFIKPTRSISTGSLQFAKQTLDAFAGQVCDEQQHALRGAAKKRKREAGHRAEVLKIRKIHINGFETGQVWQQAKRIISTTLERSNELLRELENNKEAVPRTHDGPSNQVRGHVSNDEDEVESESGSDSGLSMHGEGITEEASTDDDDSNDEDSEDMAESVPEHDSKVVTTDAEEVSEDDSVDQNPTEFVRDQHDLNDGFFSIDDFNKESQWFEDQDARGDPNTDQVSDDEELDWHADPMSVSDVKRQAKPKTRNGDADSDTGLMDEEGSEDEDEDGPVFEDMDLYAPEGASDDGADDGDGALDDGIDLTANDIYYKDFFAPPARRGKKASQGKKTGPLAISRPDDKDVERAIDLVRRDLLEDEKDASESEDALSDVSAGDPKSRRSAHERRQAKLAEEIRKLESELVAKRAWTLSGEAAAMDRPVNSLLEEDLDFEHAGKPIPVVTEESSEPLEAMIKRRILAQEFDEVLRRRPDHLGGPAANQRGLIDVDDSKAQKSLAEIYEEEHVKNANPDTYVSQADEKLRREEKEVEQMWRDVSARLDALSNWSFKPKPAEASLTVVADVAAIAVEEAQPTTAHGLSGGDSMLAPQEIYKAGKDTAEQGETVARSGLPVAKQEMSREDKARRRRREKERMRKKGADEKKPLGKKAQAQKDVVHDLKKGAVTVINRKGELVGMDGKSASGNKKAVSSGSLKL